MDDLQRRRGVRLGDADFVGSVPGLDIHVTNIVVFARQ